jgi:hypothetical protein
MDACLAALPSALSLQKGRTESVRSLSALLRALSLSVRAEHGGAPLAAIAELVKLQATTAVLGLRRPSAQIGRSTTFPSRAAHSVSRFQPRRRCGRPPP